MPSTVSYAGPWPSDAVSASPALSKEPGEPVTTRRVFLGTLACAILAAPCAAGAQQAGKVYRVGLISVGSPLPEMAGPEPVYPPTS